MSNNDNFYKRYVEGPIESIGLYEEKKFFFTPAHDALLNTAWKMLLDKPLLGHGPKLFRIKCKEEKYLNYNETCNNHPHNFYMQHSQKQELLGFYFFLVYLFILFVTYLNTLCIFKTRNFYFLIIKYVY